MADNLNAQGILDRQASINVENLSRTAILKELSRQTKIRFIYSQHPDLLENVSMVMNNRTMKEVLDQLFRGKNITYSLFDDRIVIEPHPKVQQKSIRGIVKSIDGKPLSGVSIGIRGKKTMTSSNQAGEFSIMGAPQDVLYFKYLGYLEKEMVYSGQDYIQVTLSSLVKELDVVVINTGYQNIDRKKFTGAAVKINAEDVQRPGVPDVSRMLEGQAAGVSVQNVSGTFGAAPKIRVRGSTSITGDNKPLWVVDGVILEDVINISNEQLSSGDPNTLLGSSVAGLNADDIESFQILKDVAATSLYGARAMNGVVLITTKRGKAGARAALSYSGNYSSYMKPGYQQFDIVNSYDQMSIFAEMERKGWLDYTDLANNPNGGVYTKLAQSLRFNEDGTAVVENSVSGRKAFLERYVYANTDWFDILFKNSLMQEHSLSLSSGTEKSQQYFSTSYLRDNGWSLGDKADRYTANVRSDFSISPKFSVGLITTASIRDQLTPGSLGRQSNPVTGEVSRDFDINPFSYALNTTRTLTPYDQQNSLEYFTMNYAPFNIINELQNNTIELRMLDLKVQGEAKYRLPKDINYSFVGSYRYVNTENEHKIREQSNMPMAYRAGTIYAGGPENATIADRNKFLYTDPADPDSRPVSVLPYGGFYTTNGDNLKSFYFRNSLDWTQSFNFRHTLRLFLSQELRFLDRVGKTFTGYGYQFDRGGTAYVDPNAIKREVEGSSTYYQMATFHDRYLAFAGNAAYSFLGKYQLNGTVRYDGSNQMGQSTTARWLPTWNISGSWNLDEEAFLKDSKAFNTLTLRATYGLNASMGNARNSSLIIRSASTKRPYLSEVEPVLNIENNPNKDLTWEKQYEFNMGVDAAMFNRRLEWTVDVYRRQGFDLIGLIRTSGIGGEAFKLANYADMQSQGIELMVKSQVFKRDNWGWKMQLTNAYNTGEITRLLNEPLIFHLIGNTGGAKVGYPVRGLFSIPFSHLDPNTGVPYFINEQGVKSTNVYLQSYETGYLNYEGNIDPTFTGGFYNMFNYKNLSLSALVTYSAGNKIRQNAIFQNQYTDLQAMSRDFLDRFVLPNDYQVPSIVEMRNASRLEGSAYQSYNYSTERVADGGFVRLKQVSLNYEIPHKLINRWGLNKLSLSVVGNNLYLIYADKKLNGQDPEFYGSGGVALPIPRQFTLSIKTSL
ncbi:SusC/RagA family TonB-linked outer membrane protein [Sphingobacterium humi]|uniref:SusC/RagA family TonB-linked outer membrane protein n=2 Tax=Sphingobacterium humi TaxID=1796905 RepID=A0A6N8L499_9SPHI|nr:SusC/RagA family TonB-linked outer membrane protein [Sphingobacterium humi]